jgi:hypothetical protein
MRPVFSLLLSAIDDTAIEQELLHEAHPALTEDDLQEQRAEQRAALKWQSLANGCVLFADVPKAA